MVSSEQLANLESYYLNGLKRGDSIAFKKMFDNYYKILVAVSYKILLDRELAESVVQDVFVNLWSNRETAIINSLKGYLVVSVKNRSLNEIKRAKRFVSYNTLQPYQLPNDDFDVQSDVDAIEHIMNSINELPEQRRKIFRMNRLDGLKYAEIASELNLSIKTVEAQMSSALKYMRERLSVYKDLVTVSLLFFALV